MNTICAYCGAAFPRPRPWRPAVATIVAWLIVGVALIIALRQL
jgi:hypothetical protein